MEGSRAVRKEDREPDSLSGADVLGLPLTSTPPLSGWILYFLCSGGVIKFWKDGEHLP